MVEYLPDPLRKGIVSVGIALIPILIGNLLISPLLANPDINITALEFHNKTSNQSTIYAIIENLGNLPSENIKIYFSAKNQYALSSYKSVDSIPINYTDKEGHLRVNIERIAPHAFTILQTNGIISDTEKTIWLASDKQTKFVTLPKNSTDSGISSLDLQKDDAPYVTGGIGILSLLIFRYINFYKSETKRRDFLGTHQIKILKYKSLYFLLGLVAIIVGIGIGHTIDSNNQKLQIADYKAYNAFPLNKNMTVNQFLSINNPNTSQITGGAVFSFLSILFALWVSNKDINLPKFDWSLKPLPVNVKVNQISSSYLKSAEYSIKTRRDLSKENMDIFVVTDGLEIIGLLSAKEIEKLEGGKKPIKSTIKSKKLPSPNWDEASFRRDNFIVVNENTTLEELRKQMENASRIYAVIQDSSKNILGVMSHDILFGTPNVFA